MRRSWPCPGACIGEQEQAVGESFWFLEGLSRRRHALNRYTRNLHLHRIHNRHLDLQRRRTHCVLQLRFSPHLKCRIKEGAELITYQSKPPPSASQSPRRHISLYISRPPTTTSQPSAQPLDPTSHYVQTPQPIHHYTCLSCGAFPTHPRDTCSWCPAHKHLIDPRTIGPLDDFLVHIHPYNHARKLSQRA